MTGTEDSTKSRNNQYLECLTRGGLTVPSIPLAYFVSSSFALLNYADSFITFIIFFLSSSIPYWNIHPSMCSLVTITLKMVTSLQQEPLWTYSLTINRKSFSKKWERIKLQPSKTPTEDSCYLNIFHLKEIPFILQCHALLFFHSSFLQRMLNAHQVGQTYFIHIVNLIFDNMTLMYNKYIQYSLVYFHLIIVLCRQLLI